MKTQDPAKHTRLVFRKEQIAHLSAADLDQIMGGQVQGHCNSSRVNFTCQLCTGLIQPASPK